MGKRDVFNKGHSMYIRYELEDTDDFEKYDDIDDDVELVCLWYVYTTSGRRVAAFCTEAQAKEAVEIYNSYRSEGQSLTVSMQYAGLI